MGVCLSTAANILEHNDGDQAAFDERFSMEKRILGEGEFGQVKLVYDKNDATRQCTLARFFARDPFLKITYCKITQITISSGETNKM